MRALDARIERQISVPVHPGVSAFAAKLAAEAGAQAALFYGSNLRTGELEGVLDFYLLMDGPQQEKIWPTVSYHEWAHNGAVLRAKVARMAMETFVKAANGQSYDTTIWARFVQPSALVWSAGVWSTGVWGTGEKARAGVIDAIAGAVQTAGRLAAALGPGSGAEEDYWRALFQATYQAEFRVEKAGREDSILSLNQAHFAGLLPLGLAAQGIAFDEQDGQITVDLSPDQRRAIVKWWRSRKRFGKPLNLIRLMKATTTFEGAGAYAAWKVERHTGVPVEVTPWREKHPILAAPGILFKVWQAKRKL